MSASELVLAANAYALITCYELRYSMEQFDIRQRMRRANFNTLVSGAAARHYSDCCRAWGLLTGGKYARFYDGVSYKQVSSQLDDWQCEGVASREALALCGLPVFESGKVTA